MSNLSKHIADLDPRKRELLERLMRQQGVDVRRSLIMPRRHDQENVPLSFAQERLWFLNQLEPDSPFYNVALAVRLRGHLDVAILEQCFATIARRHAVLRARFSQSTATGGVRQVIAPEQNVPLPVVDLRQLSSSEQQTIVQQRSRQEARQPFDLEHGPLLRTGLFQLAADEHLLLLTLHHIVADGWSLGVLLREVAALYGADAHQQPGLPDLTIQYADFAAWQHEWLAGDTLERQLRYWQQQLADLPPTLQLPTDRVRPAIQTFRGARHPLALDRTLVTALKELSQREGATLFMTLLAAVATLLYRYSGQDDIVVGTPIAGRNRPETEPLIGCFVNTLALRARLQDSPTFRVLLERVRQVTLDAYAHQDLPFEKLVEALQPERDLSRTPLFQLMLVLQNAPLPALELPGLRLEAEELDTGTAKFDLTLNLTEQAGGISGWLEYNTDIFDPTTIERLLGHLQTLLASIAADPDQALDHLALLTAAERQRALAEQNTGAAVQIPHPTIPTWFEAQAARTPAATAVICEAARLSYAELNQRANQLAHHLRALGVGPETLVGVCLDRSLDLVVGLLAILKAGGAYVPLDPSYPAERLAFMLQDARVPVLLTESALVERLPQPQPGADHPYVLCIDGERTAIAERPRTNPISGVTGDHLAYVIYTSGSTGQPKGVLIAHQQVTRLLAATNPWFHFDERDVWTLFHSYAFDFSVWELWGALLYGGRLIVVPYWVTRAPELFYALVRAEGVTVLNQTPAAFRQLMQAEEDAGGDLALRLVIFGGEALDLPSLQPWFARRGDQRPQLVNMYGITETTVHVTYRPLTQADSGSMPGSMIGWPIPDLRLYVLDRRLQPVPVGVPGELYVGGAGVARGYLDRPALTAERFIPDPFGVAGARLYKTGDVARYVSNGDLEYLGRNDDQVKIRGFRIELGEIEAALARHPALREARVLARHAGTPGKASTARLIAYVVAHPGQSVTAGELRDQLKLTLPDYMLPAAFVWLDRFPLTEHGKLDYAALPVPGELGAEQPNGDPDYIAPQTPEEEVIAAVWRQVLGVERIGSHANFFDLGGDSIRSIQMRALLQQQGFTFALPQLFRHPTVQALARELTPVESRTAESPSQPFALVADADREAVTAAVEDAYPLTQLQEGMLFHSRLNPDAAIYHDIFSFHLQLDFDDQALEQAIQQLAARHAVLRTAIDMTSYSEPLQLVYHTVTVPLAVDDLRLLTPAQQDTAVTEWIAAEKSRPFNWTQAPLLRFQVHRRSSQSFQFTISFHHVILDGWSLATLLTELFQRYVAALHGTSAEPEPPLVATFREFVALEQAALESSEQQGFWRHALRDASTGELPRLGAAPALDHRTLHVALPSDLSAALKQLASIAGVPLKSVLLTAHLKVMSLLTGQRDVVTGLVANGRSEGRDGERALGLFLNTLPFRLNLDHDTWLALIQATFAAERESFPHRRYPLARIQRMLGGQVLFETAFNFIHFHVYQGLLNLPDLQVLGMNLFQKTNFALTAHFSLELQTSRVQLELECNAPEIDDAQLEQIGGYYARVLAAMTAAPTASHTVQHLLSLREHEQVLVRWNATPDDYPTDRCVHHLFEAQAAITPDAYAVEFAEQRLTYRELEERANQLAHYLQQLGVGPDVCVGICVERSLEMIVGVLGILKAGGAYLPLDPAYPPERLGFMLADAQVGVLLTQQALRDRLPQHTARSVLVDSDWPMIAELRADRPTSAVLPDHLAYVIYTSGSTGRPKGVAMQHRPLTNLIAYQQKHLRLRSGARTLQFSSLNFDASFNESFATWHAGGTLVLIPEELRRDMTRLLRLIDEAAIERLFVPVVALQQLAEVAQTQGSVPRRLREVLSTAEQLQITPPIAALFAQLDGAVLYNEYGPSETHVVTTWTLEGQPQTWPALPPIGRPIGYTQAYLLDRSLQPVPPGVTGELYIGGISLARGYLNRPDLTAEKFIPDPFSVEPGARLYRTGDLARYQADGAIKFLGRIDHQIKIRGFRVELGEIEAVLGQYPNIREAVVVARQDQPGQKRLVAYIVPQTLPGPTISALRSFVQERLPDYMVPAAAVLLERLPLNPSGKVDRPALPAPTDDRPDLAAAYVGPRTPLERLLAGIWADVLRVERVGVEDNFFDLGGDSLLAVRAHERVCKAMQRDIPIVKLFQYSTIAALAQFLSAEPEQPRSRPQESQAWADKRKQALSRQRQQQMKGKTRT